MLFTACSHPKMTSRGLALTRKENGSGFISTVDRSICSFCPCFRSLSSYIISMSLISYIHQNDLLCWSRRSICKSLRWVYIFATVGQYTIGVEDLPRQLNFIAITRTLTSRHISKTMDVLQDLAIMSWRDIHTLLSSTCRAWFESKLTRSALFESSKVFNAACRA